MNLKSLITACGKISNELICDASHKLCLAEDGGAVLVGEATKVIDLHFYVNQALFDEMTDNTRESVSLPFQEKGVQCVRYRNAKFFLADDKVFANRKVFVSGKVQVNYVV